MPEPKTAAVAVGRAVRSLRTERGRSQEAFAAEAGIDRSYYGAIERGGFNVTLDTLLKIAAALEMPVAEVLERAGL